MGIFYHNYITINLNCNPITGQYNLQKEDLSVNESATFLISYQRKMGKIDSTNPGNQPNAETIASMIEAERISKDTTVNGYTDLNELISELNND